MKFSEVKKAFGHKVAQLLKAMEEREGSAVDDAARLLNEVRKEIISRIAQASSQFNLSVYLQVQTSIDAILREFGQEMTLHLNDGADEFEGLGARFVADPVKIVTSAPLHITRTVAQIVAGYSADLIRGLTADMRSGINSVLRRTLLGAISPDQAISEIGRDLQGGLFKGFMARAERIVRTEVLRVHSIAAYGQMKAARESMLPIGYDLRRSWLAAKDKRVRLSHVLVNGQERGVDELFELPIITAGAVVGFESLLYPRDPAASAANSINCRCVAIPKIVKLSTSQSIDPYRIAA